jgi:hypothetical protein
VYPARDLGSQTISVPLPAPATDATAPTTPTAPAPVDVVVPTVDVVVSTLQLADELPVYEISAAADGHTETQRHSIGVSGTNPEQSAPMSAAELQAWLDERRLAVATNAAWHSVMKASTANVK